MTDPRFIAPEPEFDVIVVGSGMTGGWAAKEFTEKGFNTLVLERGRHVEHRGPEYTDQQAPWQIPNRDLVPEYYEDTGSYSMLRIKSWAYKNASIQFFVDEKKYPYSYPEDAPFMWTRGHQTGGRSLTWGRQTYRWGPKDFEANKKDGHGLDWPIRYEDLVPWYSYVERFIGVSGNRDGLPNLPDSEFQPPFELSCAERFVSDNLSKTYPDRHLIIGRVAHLTQPTEEQIALGRAQCQVRSHCMRGCSYGAYYSSQAGSLAAAKKTGRMTLVNHTIVHSIIHDPKTGRATGVRVIDHETNEVRIYTARVIFLCASALGSVQVLLNSRSSSHPNGLANSSGKLGAYIMDHIGAVGATGRVPGFHDRYHFGRRPIGFYIPNYRHDIKDGADFVRGYGFEGGAFERATASGDNEAGIGIEAKRKIGQPTDWYIHMNLSGEMLPYADNRATLHPTKTDRWGIPQIHIDARHRANEDKMAKQAVKDAVDILSAGGCEDIAAVHKPPQRKMVGQRTHEMGGASMGRDPRSSVLNGWGQAHDVCHRRGLHGLVRNAKSVPDLYGDHGPCR